MAIVFTSFIVNVFLNYSLIFGHYGFPEIGGVGAGYGIAGACWTNLVLFSLVILLHPKAKRDIVSLKTSVNPKFSLHSRTITNWYSHWFSIFLEASIFSIAGLLMVHFGSAVVAAHQSVISFTNVFYCLPLVSPWPLPLQLLMNLGQVVKKEAIQYSYISRILAIVIGYS